MKEGFPSSSADKESACNEEDLVSISWLGRSPGEEKGYPLQYSGLGIPWIEKPGRLYSVGHKELDTTE